MTTNTKSTYAELRTMCLGILQDLEDAHRAASILSKYAHDYDSNWLHFPEDDDDAQSDRLFFLEKFDQYVDRIERTSDDDGRHEWAVRLDQGADDTADQIRQESTECLDITYCKNVKGDCNDYCSILFTAGGPHIEAVREPGQSHFEIRGYWGGERVSIPDFEDLIPYAFCIEDLAASY